MTSPGGWEGASPSRAIIEERDTPETKSLRKRRLKMFEGQWNVTRRTKDGMELFGTSLKGRSCGLHDR